MIEAAARLCLHRLEGATIAPQRRLLLARESSGQPRLLRRASSYTESQRLPEFKSSWRQLPRSCDASTEATTVGSGTTRSNAFTWSSTGRTSRGLGSVSGQQSPKAWILRTPDSWREAHPRLPRAGSGKVGACLRSVRPRCRADSCRSSRRSRCCAPAAVAYARSTDACNALVRFTYRAAWHLREARDGPRLPPMRSDCRGQRY